MTRPRWAAENDGGIHMSTDQKSTGTRGGSHEQHVKAGQERHKNSNSQAKDDDQKNQSSGSTRGGTSEQHAEAGRQSHQNDK